MANSFSDKNNSHNIKQSTHFLKDLLSSYPFSSSLTVSIKISLPNTLFLMSCFSNSNSGFVTTRELRLKTTAGVYEGEQIHKDTSLRLPGVLNMLFSGRKNIHNMDLETYIQNISRSFSAILNTLFSRC